jgi:hypothetical protein
MGVFGRAMNTKRYLYIAFSEGAELYAISWRSVNLPEPNGQADPRSFSIMGYIKKPFPAMAMVSLKKSGARLLKFWISTLERLHLYGYHMFKDEPHFTDLLEIPPGLGILHFMLITCTYL